MKAQIFLAIFVAIAITGTFGQVGAPEEFDDAELAKSIINEGFVKLNGNGHELVLIKLHKSTRQVVAGSLYKFSVTLTNKGEQDDCLLEVWQRPWIPEGTEFTASCGQKPQLKAKY